MKVIIADTNEEKEINFIAIGLTTDYTKEILQTFPSDFYYDASKGAYVCASLNTFNWWKKFCDESYNFITKIDHLKEMIRHKDLIFSNRVMNFIAQLLFNLAYVEKGNKEQYMQFFVNSNKELNKYFN